MQGLGEAIDKIVKLNEGTHKPKSEMVPATNGIRQRWNKYDKDGSPIGQITEPEIYKSNSLTGLVQVVKEYRERKEESQPRLGVTPAGVSGFLDADSMYDLCYCPFKLTNTFGFLYNATNARGVEMTQKELVWLLRTTLDNAFEPQNFAAQAKALKFSTNSMGSATLKHGNETHDAQIEQMVSGQDNSIIPETILVTCPVFDGAEFRDDDFCTSVRVDIDVDAVGKKFTLLPRSDDINAAFENVVKRSCDFLDSRIDDESVVVYQDVGLYDQAPARGES